MKRHFFRDDNDRGVTSRSSLSPEPELEPSYAQVEAKSDEDKGKNNNLKSSSSSSSSSLKGEMGNVLLLIALYFLQGIPMGLVFGSIPFLLKANLTLTQIGVFSVAS